jgi:AcrR family transcriptional regulator
MSPRTKSQLEQMRAETQKSILQSALKLFAKKGFDRTTIDDIAGAAKISKGLVYHYFNSKDEILDTLIRQAFEEAMSYGDGISEHSAPSEMLKAWVTQTMEQLQSHRIQWQLFFSIIFQPAISKKIGAFILEYRSKAMEQMVDTMTRFGSPNPIADSMLFGSLLDGIALNYILSPNDMPMKEMTDRINESISFLIKDRK